MGGKEGRKGGEREGSAVVERGAKKEGRGDGATRKMTCHELSVVSVASYWMFCDHLTLGFLAVLWRGIGYSWVWCCCLFRWRKVEDVFKKVAKKNAMPTLQ